MSVITLKAPGERVMQQHRGRTRAGGTGGFTVKCNGWVTGSGRRGAPDPRRRRHQPRATAVDFSLSGRSLCTPCPAPAMLHGPT
jgi:hypothetical protein